MLMIISLFRRDVYIYIYNNIKKNPIYSRIFISTETVIFNVRFYKVRFYNGYNVPITSSRMISQISCVMSSFGVRGLNTAAATCGDTITVVSGRTYSIGNDDSLSDESEPSSSGCVRGHPSGCGDEGDEVVDLSIGLTSSIGSLSPGWMIAGTSTAGLVKASILLTSSFTSLFLYVVIRARDLFDIGAIHFGVAKTASSSSSLGAGLLYASLIRCKPLY